MKRVQTPEPGQLIRINRYLSMCGIASRRKADQLLTEGKIQVDGRVVTDLGSKVDPRRNKVFIDGRQVVQVYDFLHLVMNKPKDTITTLSDERGRETVMSLLHEKQRVYPIGRLDRNTTGVLLFTNDGEFANRLMHPKYEIEKSYKVTCDKPVLREHLEKLRKGVQLEGVSTAPADVYALPGSKGKEVGIVIHEGRNRQVRKMFETLGYDVRKLDRVAYGPVTLEGLPRGRTRRLSPAEVRTLRQLAGLEPQR